MAADAEQAAVLTACYDFFFNNPDCSIEDLIKFYAAQVNGELSASQVIQVTALAKACFDQFPVEEAPNPADVVLSGPATATAIVRRLDRVERDRTGYIIAFNRSYRVDWDGQTGNGWVTITAQPLPGYRPAWIEGGTYAVSGDQRPIDGTANNNRLDMPDVPWNDGSRLYLEHFSGKAEEVRRRTTINVRWVKS